MHIYGAILAGGTGTRLWPRSRLSHPKQFTDITGSGRTMIQATMDRLTGLVAPEDVYVLTGERYRGLVLDQLPEMPAHNAVVEPSGRNTAPAIGLACVHLLQRDAEAVLVVLPADHVITDVREFQSALRRAVAVAQEGYLVTLGVEPNYPHTGYGYIQRADLIAQPAHDALAVYRVMKFHEKPDLETAERFLATGQFYWNGGIFVARADRMLAEIERQLPAVHASLRAIAAGLSGADPAGALAAAWDAMPNISIDYGVMEGAERVAVVPLRAGWNDVGSWDALEGVIMPDHAGNLNADSDLLSVDSFNNIVYCQGKLIALVGVDDLVVVDTGDALLIGHRKQMQKVREVVEALRKQERFDLL